MKTLPLRPQWLPTNEAAAALGIHRRTLVRRARAGKVATRPGEDGAVLYGIPEGTAAHRATMAPPHDTTMAPRGETPPLPPPSAVLSALEAALVRAGRAEAERDAAREELATLRAELDAVRAELATEAAAHASTMEAGRALEARHRKRGELLRRISAQR